MKRPVVVGAVLVAVYAVAWGAVRLGRRLEAKKHDCPSCARVKARLRR